LLAATLALVLSWLLATGILDPGAPARAQAARKLDLTRLPEPTNDLRRLLKPASTSAPTTASPAATTAFDPLPSCQAPGFLCKDGLTCAAPAQVCDGLADCPRHEEGEGGEDEEGCSGSGGGQPDEAILASPILVALTSRPEVSTERQVEEEGSNILEEETQNVLSEVLRVVDETRRRLEETKDSKAGGVTGRGEATTEAATFDNTSEVTKEVDNLVASTTKEEEVEEPTQVTGEDSNVSAGSTKPTEVWTLRPNWSTGGSTLQEVEETTIKVLTTIDDTTEVTSSPTEQATAIGESVTTVAVETTAENITPAVTETVTETEDIVTPTVTETVKTEDIITPAVTETVKTEDIITQTVTETISLIDATSLSIESASVTEESSTESARADLTTTVAPVTADEDDSSVTTENAVTTDQSEVNDDKKDFPEVKLEREDNEVEIDAESEKEASVEEEEEFGAEQPRAFS
jgi:hypothetical protein